MIINTLILETTRKCNLVCKHCLRGPSEEKEADRHLLPNIFYGITEVNELIFTGGEPGLNIKYMDGVLEYCMLNHIKVNSIYLATNGTVNQEELIRTMNDWLAYCMMVTESQDIHEYLKKHHFRLACSVDEFHRKLNTDVYNKFKQLSFYDDSKEISYLEDNYYLIESGNVLLYGLDASGEYLCGISGEELFDFGIDNDIINQVYISCNGYIYSGCNYDYETLDNNISPDNSLSIQSLLDICCAYKKGVNLYDCHNMCG